MNPNPDTEPATPESQPVDVRTISSPLPDRVPMATPARPSAWYRNLWLWISVVLLATLIGTTGYFLSQDMKDNSNNTATNNTTDESDKADVEDTPAASDPYKGWTTFTSKMNDLSFKHPNTMTVDEISGQTSFVYLRAEGQSASNNKYVLQISDGPWGCTGPDTYSLTYTATIGKTTKTIEEACLGLFTPILLSDNKDATLFLSAQSLLDHENEVDLVLASMTGITVK